MQYILSIISSIFSIKKILNLSNTQINIIVKYLNLTVNIWRTYHDLWSVIYCVRFNVFVLALGAAVLFLEQGRELALRVDDSTAHVLFFLIGLFFWALQNWFGPRRLLEERFGRPNSASKVWKDILIRHVPRVMGATAYVFASFALFFASHFILLLVTLLNGVVFYYIFIKRNDWLKATKWARYINLNEIGKILRPFTITYSVFFVLTSVLFPAHLGFWAGSLGILFFGLSSIVSAGNWAIRYTEHLCHPDFNVNTSKFNDSSSRVSGFPVISILLIWAFFWSFFNDNHDIRILDQESERLTLSKAFDGWQLQAKEDSKGIKPLVIVATAGGGIRASYWTATVLGGLTDAEPRFRNALFAVSGVSGGSVGSVFYQAALQEGGDCDQSAVAMQPKRGSTCYEGLTQSALGRDFLAPNLSSLLYSDLIQRFLPPIGLPDRQQALEKGWELSWRNTYKQAKTEGVAAPLISKAGIEWLPIQLLNSTHMETGKRVVASSVLLNDKFIDTVDLFSLIGSDIRLSTAAGNSARFTYVSPAGTLPCKQEGGLFSKLWNGLFCHNGHVVDGGYFENFGAITANQTLKALQDLNVPVLMEKVKPIIIVISSDPLLACTKKRKEADKDKKCDSIDTDDKLLRLTHKSGANESLGPIKALFSTRSARGILAAKELYDWVKTCEKIGYCGFGAAPEFYHFRMEVPDGQPDPALGWLLSRESEKVIAGMLTSSSTHNKKMFECVLASLGNPQDSKDCKIVSQ